MKKSKRGKINMTDYLFIGEKEATEAKARENAINWKDLSDFVDKPVYDDETKKWYILHGYKQYGNEKTLYLSDKKQGVNFDDVLLFATDSKQ